MTTADYFFPLSPFPFLPPLYSSVLPVVDQFPSPFYCYAAEAIPCRDRRRRNRRSRASSSLSTSLPSAQGRQREERPPVQNWHAIFSKKFSSFEQEKKERGKRPSSFFSPSPFLSLSKLSGAASNNLGAKYYYDSAALQQNPFLFFLELVRLLRSLTPFLGVTCFSSFLRTFLFQSK